MQRDLSTVPKFRRVSREKQCFWWRTVPHLLGLELNGCGGSPYTGAPTLPVILRDVQFAARSQP